MSKREPSNIYAILAYSKKLNTTKQEFDEDALNNRFTVDERLATLKAESLATRLNAIKHQGATDWVARPKLQPFRPDGKTRGAQIRNPTSIIRSQG
jgi:hypothetical protein